MNTRKQYRDVSDYLAQTRMTQKELAAKVGCSPSVMCRIVAGTVTPGFRLACRIARVARVPVQSMLPAVDRVS